MKRLKYYFRLYQAFLRIGMLCLVQYPMDSTIRLISIVAREAAGFLGVFAIANVVGNLGEWSIYGVCLIFSLGAMTEAISRGLLDNVWSIGSFVRKGKLDIFLIRPASVLFQMLTFRMEFASLVSFFLPCSLMIWSLAKSGVECSISLIAFLIEFLVMGTILNSSLYLIFNALNFWLVQGNKIADLIQTFREFAKYPINIFPAVFQVLFTVVIPFGFIGYYPAMYLLGKTKMCVPMWLLAVTLLFALASVLIWCCGMKKYDSTGT